MRLGMQRLGDGPRAWLGACPCHGCDIAGSAYREWAARASRALSMGWEVKHFHAFGGEEYVACGSRDKGCGADSLKAQLVVEHLAPRIIDASKHLLDPKYLFCHLAGHDIRVVEVGDRGESVRLLNPGCLQDISVNARAKCSLSLEPVRQAVKRFGE